MRKYLRISYFALTMIFISLFLSRDLAAIDSNNFEHFQNVLKITDVNISATSVLEVPLNEDYIKYDNVIVHEIDTDKLFRGYLKQTEITNPISYHVETIYNDTNDNFLTDKNTQTHIEFPFENGQLNTTILKISSVIPIKSHSVGIFLDEYVASPLKYAIYTNDSGVKKTVVAETLFGYEVLNFPETTSQNWEIILSYAQPLRLTEVKVFEENASSTASQSIRFLGKSQMSYDIYYSPDSKVIVGTEESGNLTSDQGVIKYEQSIVSSQNPYYKESDFDIDGIPDKADNCIKNANADQTDVNNNKVGDACDDFDRDKVINSEDNCIDDPNTSQTDSDGDKLGDVCDDSESRFTEKYPVLIWIGAGLVTILVALVLTYTIKTSMLENNNKT